MTNEVVRFIENLRVKAQNYQNEIANKLLLSKQEELPTGLFGMIFNTLTLGLELLHFYYNTWDKKSQTNCASVKDAKNENAERVILIQKMIFINTMSAIEFCFKEYVNQFPHKIGNCQNRQGWVYLSRITKESKDNSIINDTKLAGWQGMIELRNSLVHNNGIAEKTEQYTYTKCTLTLEEGEKITGNLKLFPHLIDWLLDSSKEWITEMNKK